MNLSGRAMPSCGKCFASKSVISQSCFATRTEAFCQYAEFIRRGSLPMLCETDGGAFRVCAILPEVARQDA
jgi:hypothetical protein